MMNKSVIYKPQINNHYNLNFVATGVSTCVCECVCVCLLKGERVREEGEGRETERLSGPLFPLDNICKCTHTHTHTHTHTQFLC